MDPWDCFKTPVTFKPGDRVRIQYKYHYPGADNQAAHFMIRELGNEERKLELEGMYHSYHMLYDLVRSKAINRAPEPLNNSVLPYLLKIARQWSLTFSKTFCFLVLSKGWRRPEMEFANLPIQNWLLEAMFPTQVLRNKMRQNLHRLKFQNSGMSGGMMPTIPHFLKLPNSRWATKKLYYQTRTN